MHFNWISYFVHSVGEHNIHIISALIVFAVIMLIALVVRSHLLKLEQSLVPASSFSLSNGVEVALESLFELAHGVLGHAAKKHFPLIVTIFLYIFVSNVMGMIPGFYAPTLNMNTNLAVGLFVFVYFNFMGVKEHGFINYIKHFAGPLWWLAPLIFAIEIFGTAIRPITLSLRLFSNINADHMVLNIFSNLGYGIDQFILPIFIPIVFMILGLFICFIQAFVFTLLSTIYIGLATAHEDEHH